MDREKRIEEIAKTMHDGCSIVNATNQCRGEDCLDCGAVTLYEKGYRKASEVAKEIFEEIERILSLNYCCCLPQGATEHYEYYEGNIAKDIAELKKKYTDRR